MIKQYPIGVFDSGYGGLTILKDLTEVLPDYDFIYLGDNARAPYGTRSFETVYSYTLQSVSRLFEMGCPLVILACNTASAKALRTIQQNDLLKFGSDKRVLGVIRPTTEIIGHFSNTKEIGILATKGTVISGSYPIEIAKFYPEIKVYQEACPMWVSLVENHEEEGDGADYFIKKHIDHLLSQSERIDTLLLGCTHFPLLMSKIKKFAPKEIKLVSQGKIVAESLKNYLSRHHEMDEKIGKSGTVKFYTTEDEKTFSKLGEHFYGKPLHAEKLMI